MQEFSLDHEGKLLKVKASYRGVRLCAIDSRSAMGCVSRSVGVVESKGDKRDREPGKQTKYSCVEWRRPHPRDEE